ncbi:MAG: lysine--tRNA ligase [Candidatus Bathyarchaeia archaeon]
MSLKLIGKGTWLDKVALRLIRREEELGRSVKTFRVESGLGASGIPHIGSFADAARAYGVKLALENLGRNAEYIAFSDDKDGLRKVPRGLPGWLEDYIGYPVSAIPDPFRCHSSYGAHMSHMLLEVLDRCGIVYNHISASEAYRRGLFDEEIRIALDKAEQIGRIIRDELSQEKYLEVLPYFPVCENCGRIYTTKALKWIPREGKVTYICEGSTIAGRRVDGCGYSGEVDYRAGEGKLSWKVEFAARWSALDIDFEAYGKDIADSVRVNDRIMKEIYGKPPPLHVRYEMFLDKGGGKLSKSKGDVLTPQLWLRYGSPSSLLLLMYKRIIGTREVSVSDIPRYMDELDELEDVYFNRRKVPDEKERAKLKGLYEYSLLLKTPRKPSIHIPYRLLLYLAELAPREKAEDFILQKLREYGYKVDGSLEDVKRRILYAVNWVEDFKEGERGEPVSLTSREKEAVEYIVERMEGETLKGDEAQNLIYETAKAYNITPGILFQKLYQLLFNKPYGPRLGPYIAATGQEKIMELLRKALDNAEIKEA